MTYLPLFPRLTCGPIRRLTLIPVQLRRLCDPNRYSAYATLSASVSPPSTKASSPSTQPAAANLEAGPAFARIQQQKAFRLLIAYEGRIRRALYRDKAELQTLQSARKDQAAGDRDQAVALHNLAKTEGKPYEPEQYFQPGRVTESVFSTEAVRLESSRRETMAAAHACIESAQKN